MPQQGTIIFWFKPNWSTTAGGPSHTLFSWGWDDGKHGYCVLSDGWWEPAGAPYTYLVFENQLYLHCNSPLSFVKDQWRQFVVTWQFRDRASARLYVDGELAATAVRPCDGAPTPRTPLYLGSDRGTPAAEGRSADGVFDHLSILDRMLSKEQVRELFRAQEPNWRAVERQREPGCTTCCDSPSAAADSAGRILESRALLDGPGCWRARQAESDRADRGRLQCLHPRVWHGCGVLAE